MSGSYHERPTDRQLLAGYPHQDVAVTQKVFDKLMVITALRMADRISYGEAAERATRVCPQLRKFTINNLKVVG